MTPPLDADGTVPWERALASAVQRVQDERGVTEPWGLSTEYGHLWAHYGELGVRVAGDDPDVLRPEDLFDEIDTWEAFERPAGPGVRLDRDRAAMAEWRRALPAVQRYWTEVAPRVFRDVRAAAGRGVPWRIVVRDREVVWPEALQSGLWLVEGEHPLPEREMTFPVIALELPHTRLDLPHVVDPADIENGTVQLADAIQDEVIEEVHGARPRCLRHEHPMVADVGADGRAVWQCPRDPSISVSIGEWPATRAG